MHDLLRELIKNVKLIYKYIMSTQPLTTNHFQVEWGGTRIGFTEVSGLSFGFETIKYRDGSSRKYSPDKIPGQKKYNNIILKRGIFKGDNDFYDWLNTARHNSIERRDITIKLLDDEHLPVIVWSLRKAFPVKIEWSDLKANANEPAIESIEVTHEGMTVQNE